VRRLALVVTLGLLGPNAIGCAGLRPPEPPPAPAAAPAVEEVPPAAPGALEAPAEPGAEAPPRQAGEPPPASTAEALPPLPAPEPPPPAADLSDPLELLWGHRLEFASGGEPLVTIGLMEGQREIAFRPRAAAQVLLRGGGQVEVPAGVRLTVRARSARPARLTWSALLYEGAVAGHETMEARRRAFEADRLAVKLRLAGAVYGIAGRVLDNRRELLVVEGDDEAAAQTEIARLRARGFRPSLHAEVAERPAGTLELRGPGGAPLGEADRVLSVRVEGDAGVVVEAVEHDRGPSARAREDRAYRGRLFVTLDGGGLLAAVHGVSLEELLLGLVPSEMPGSSPPEALRAQAVTARSNVLAQLGSRHPTDPFMLCAEVHCQAYRGDGARTPPTDEAVRATRGEALFGRDDHRLVDAVYSAMCGGHGEDNDTVWGNAPARSLRGRPDLPPEEATRWAGGLAQDGRLRAFLSAPSGAYCRRGAGGAERFRWERRLDRAQLADLGAALGVGPITSVQVLSRGVSGRARAVRVEGAEGSVEVGPELRIRRALGNLPSSMFVVDRDGDALVLRGGGWGHGVGMCQWGAVGRARAGQGFRDILRAYFSGAEVARVY
jgi:SpoIID/LytB domain protein